MPIETWTEFTSIIQENAGIPLRINVVRNGEVVSLQVVPKKMEEAGREYGYVGVTYTNSFEKKPLEALYFGAEQTVTWFLRIFELLGMLVTGKFSIDALSGPVGR